MNKSDISKRKDNCGMTWQEMLAFDVIGHDSNVDSINRGVYLALQTIPLLDRYIVVMRYKHGLSMGRIEGRIGKYHARANTILNRAIKKLRHPSRVGYLIYELSNISEQEWKQKLAKKEVNRELRQLRIASGDKEDYDEETSLDNLDLSVRAFNALHKGRITTIEALIRFVDNPEDNIPLCKIPGMGRKTAEEVYKKLENYRKYSQDCN